MQTKDYWNQFYNKKALVINPSPFAVWCLEQGHISDKNSVLELGCGNGRDAFTFISKGIFTLALDAAQIAIEINNDKLEQDGNSHLGRFVALDFNDIAQLPHIAGDLLKQTDRIYCRFVLHAIPKDIADNLVQFLFDHMSPGTQFCMEFRTTKDPLFKKGEALSDTERMTDHYRRFIDAPAFRKALEAMGWEVTYFVESNGLAVFREEDPVVCRMVATRP
jgi:tellurite methyltransferase